MKKRFFLWGCLVAGLFILILAGIGGWWLLTRQPQTTQAPAQPVFVFILSPASGDEVNAGNFVTVSAQAVSAEAIQSIELFVDGQSLGKLTDPDNAFWTWQAWPLGVHSFHAQATDAKGQVGYSQVVIVNVLAGDGMMSVVAEEGQTLEQIGAGYGVPPDQMAGANPNLPPAQPLPGGQPVQVPINNIEPPDLPPGNQISIKWKIKLNQPADKYYCYVSSGNGVWEKIPKNPFEYFYGQESFYTQLVPYKGQSNIQVQCWGWVGGVLKYLGQGQGTLDPSQTQGEVKISGAGFIITTIFKLPLVTEPLLKPPKNATIPPPYALRQVSDVAECASHGDPIFTPLICNGVMNAKVKQNIVLVWEWQPEICAPGFCKYGVNEIAGYGVYEYDQATQNFVLIADIKSPVLKVTFPPIPWGGGKCYSVEAYVDMPGSQVSEMSIYCPGEQPKTQKITLTPTEWVTTGGEWTQAGDCDTYGGADYYLLANKEQGFGNQAGQVLVGSYIVDDDDEDCFKQGDYSAAVKFDIQSKLPPGAAIQKAELVFSKVFMNYGATGLAAPAPSSCVENVGKAKQDWSGLVGSAHYYGKNVLRGPAYFSPIASLMPFGALHADVTSAVKGWLKNPANNHGLILTPVAAPDPYDDGSGSCISGLGNFQLVVHYFVQP